MSDGQEAAAGSLAPTQTSITSWITRFLAGLMVEFWVQYRLRTMNDPAFNQALTDQLTALDGAKTQEDVDAAARSIRNLISS